MNKFIALIVGALLALLPCAALADSSAPAASASAAPIASAADAATPAPSPVDLPISSAPALDAIAAANTGAALLKAHSSFARYLLNYTYSEGQTIEREAMDALVGNGSGATLYSSNDALSFVFNGENRFLFYPDGTLGENICFNDDIKDYYGAQISAMNLYATYPGEKTVAFGQAGDQYILTTAISNADYSNATGQSFDLADSAIIKRTLTLNSATLEVASWQLVAEVAQGLTVQLQAGSATFDDVKLPDQYFTLADPIATRAITVVTDPGAAAENTRVFTIADGAKPFVIAPDGYVLTVKQADQYVEPDDSALTSSGDLTLYLIPQSA